MKGRGRGGDGDDFAGEWFNSDPHVACFCICVLSFLFQHVQWYSCFTFVHVHVYWWGVDVLQQHFRIGLVKVELELHCYGGGFFAVTFYANFWCFSIMWIMENNLPVCGATMQLYCFVYWWSCTACSVDWCVPSQLYPCTSPLYQCMQNILLLHKWLFCPC